MSRMLDMIARDGLQPHRYTQASRENWSDNFKDLRTMILSSTAILADNVADYFFAGTPKEDWDLMADFPNIAPPFECFWIEYKTPSALLSGDNVIELDSSHSWGFLFFAQDLMGVLPGVKWTLSALCFIANSREVRGPLCGLSAWVDEHGKATKHPDTGSALALLSIGCDNEQTKNESVKDMDGIWNPALLAISFMHCKNVELQDRPIPEKIVRARARRGRQPMFKYKVLLIEPMKKVIRQEAGEGTDLKRALHICRGHFSHYSPNRPLFGKHSGDFWIPQHVRGTVAEGMVLKDYKVKPK